MRKNQNNEVNDLKTAKITSIIVEGVKITNNSDVYIAESQCIGLQGERLQTSTKNLRNCHCAELSEIGLNIGDFDTVSQ